jgi:hypothetical protein
MLSTMMRPQPTCSRRWFVTALGTAGAMLVTAGAGCSNAPTAKKKAHSSNRNGKRPKAPKGPKTMGNLLVDSYIDDLKKGPANKQIDAAKELGNMGAGAKPALPALESLAKNGNAAVREAALQAIKSIRK